MLMMISGQVRAVTSIPVIGGGMVMLYDIARCFTLVLLGLPALIMPEIVEDTGGVAVGVQDTQHRDALGVRHLLRVARICHRLVLIVL